MTDMLHVCFYMPAGDPQVGWDTDQFLADPREATLLMGVLIKNDGLGTGGINFDAKIRYVQCTHMLRACMHACAHMPAVWVTCEGFPGI